jgi:hypothetical protein
MKVLGKSCFYYCTQLEVIKLDEHSQVTRIKERCFTYSPLKTITSPVL